MTTTSGLQQASKWYPQNDIPLNNILKVLIFNLILQDRFLRNL